MLEAAGAQMTGVRGLRMGQELVQNLKTQGPQVSDTLATMRYKQKTMDSFFENAANSVLK